MRALSALIVTFFLASACAVPSRDVELQPDPSLGPIVQFLLTSAANDFHAHGPAVAGFRGVRLGHVTTDGGEKQYTLCGEVLPARDDGKAEWTPFATIKTSGYEQWTGGQAKAFCQDASLAWDETGDLSSALKSRLNSLR